MPYRLGDSDTLRDRGRQYALEEVVGPSRAIKTLKCSETDRETAVCAWAGFTGMLIMQPMGVAVFGSVPSSGVFR